MTPVKPTLVKQQDDSASKCWGKSVPSCEPDDKDRFLCEVYDLNEARIAALARAIWDAGEPHDFAQHAIAMIHRHHGVASRGRAIAQLVDYDPKTGERLAKGETKTAVKTWPLLIAGFLPFLTLRGVSAFIVAATGMTEGEAETLLRRYLGQEVSA